MTVTVVGNDVVDLRDPRCPGKSSDRRFVQRVFTLDEAREIYDSSDPDRALWRVWAAKEAAFKVVSKLLGDAPPFEHSAFRFSAGTVGPTVGGTVTFQGSETPVRFEERPDRIHALAWHPPSAPPRSIHKAVKFLPGLEDAHGHRWKESLRDRFSEREWRSIHHPASALVRLNARGHLARTLTVQEGTIEIICDEGPAGRMPPRVYIGGESWPGDLSLSHHGRFLAWAFRAPTEEEP